MWAGRAPLAAGGTATADYNCEPGRGRSKLNDENVDFLFDVSNFLQSPVLGVYGSEILINGRNPSGRRVGKSVLGLNPRIYVLPPKNVSPVSASLASLC